MRCSLRPYIIRLIPVIIFLFSTYAYAQDDLSRFAGKKIYSIKTVSASGLTDKSIENVCEIKRGDIFSVRVIKECIISFYQKGIYNDVLVDAFDERDGITLQFTLIEKIKAGIIKTEGNDYFSDKKIMAVAGVGIGDELTEAVTKAVRDRVLDFYRGFGFFDTEIRVQIITAKDQGNKLLIKVHEGKRARISGIVINGNKIFTYEKLMDVMKLRKGSYYLEKDVAAGIKALEKYFLNKGYIKVLINPPELLYDKKEREVLLTLNIDAGPHVEVLFEGANAVETDILTKKLLFWKERSIDSAVIDESVDRLIQYYRKNGYYMARITYSVDQPDNNNVKIKFNITEGISVKIKKIGFSGNSYFNEKILREFLDTKKNKFFLEDVLKEDIKEIINLYRSNGFLEINITYDVIYSEVNSGLNVIINIEEGIQTLISGIRFTGNNKFSAETLKSRLTSREGKPFNESQAIDDLYSIQSFYVQNGYIYTTVDLKTGYSPDKKGVVTDYIINEGDQVYIGNILISGNTFTKEYVIRRELLVKEGDLYSYENILRSQRRLLTLGVFRDVRLDPINPEVKEQRKDLSLQVREGYPGSVEFGIGYGDVERFRGSFETRYRNLFGTGRQVGLKVEASSIEQKYGIDYKEPWVLGYPMDGRFNVVDQAEKKRSFDRHTFGMSTGIDKSFSDLVKGSLIYQYEDVRLSHVRKEAILTPEDTGKTEVATINPSLTIDRRDDPFNPARGQFYSIGFREAARLIGSTPQFAKVNLQSSFFYSPFSKVVLAFSGRGGVAWNFGESIEVPIFERYFIGGRSTVRGYDQEKLGIPGKTIIFDGKSWNPTGGNMMIVLNGEIRFPLFKGLGMVVFVDWGNVWRKMEEFDPSELKATAGAGIRYNTPVGPLRLDMGCKLMREQREDKCIAHFTLGHAF